jgi:hypothetical protein
MLWEHVFQAVVCVLSAVQLATARHSVQTPQPETRYHNTAAIIPMYFYWLILQKCNFSKAQRKLPEDGPEGPKHVGANIEIF